MNENPKTLNWVIGLAAAGSGVVGAGALLAALLAFFSGQLAPAAVFLIAAALAFGLIANAVLRE